MRRWTVGDPQLAGSSAFVAGHAWVTASLGAAVRHLTSASAEAWAHFGQLSPPAAAAAAAAAATAANVSSTSPSSSGAGTSTRAVSVAQVFIQTLEIANLGKQTSWQPAVYGVSPTFLSRPSAYSGFATPAEAPPSTVSAQDVISRLYTAAGSQQVRSILLGSGAHAVHAP